MKEQIPVLAMLVAKLVRASKMFQSLVLGS
jgi:hypothetical protein